jgi:uncharacterized protein YegJ (DUF2314 family)
VRRAFILLICLGLLACSQKPAAIPDSTAAPGTQADADLELDSAIRQARDTLDLFVEKLKTPHPDRTFVAVKARFFPPDDLPQDIWVDEVTYSDGAFRGNMGDDIPSLKLEAGEKITVDREDILDWMIVEDGKLIGGYTIRLAVQRMTPEERERFLEMLDYTIED